METIDFIGIYLIQMVVCVLINIYKKTRIPNSIRDFFNLTFLPWRLYHLNDDNLKKK